MPYSGFRRLSSFLPVASLVSILSIGDADARSDVPATLYTTGPPNIFYHDVNEIELMVTNVGRVGNGQLGLDGPSLGWRGGEYLYMGGLWIGALDADGVPRVSTGGYAFELLPSLDPVDTIYANYEGAPGSDRNGYSDQPDDDGDGAIDEEFHNGKDDDGDGRVDEDLAATSQQMFSCEYWDYTEESQDLNPSHKPMGMFVRQQTYAFSHPEYDQFIGIDYEIRHDGDEALTEVYVGLMIDSDVGPSDVSGYWSDDGGSTLFRQVVLEDPELGSCSNRSRSLEMAYMYDVPDDIAGTNHGDVGGFLGVLYLGSTTDLTGRRAPVEAGLHTAVVYPSAVEFGSDGLRYGAMASGTISRHSEVIDDHRMLVSVGPFPRFEPGQTVTVSFAYVIGEGYVDPSTRRPWPDLDNDGEPTDKTLLVQATRALEAYEGRWRDLDRNPETGVKGRETCVETDPGDPFLWIAPCAASGFFNFDGTTCEDPEAWVDADCDPCTPNMEHEGCENGGCEAQARWYVPRPGARKLVAVSSHSPAQQNLLPARTGESSRDTAASRLTLHARRGELGEVEFRIEADVTENMLLRVFDAAGRAVTEAETVRVTAGQTEWSWSSDRGHVDLGSGVYFARLIGSEVEATTRFVLVD